MSEVYIEKEVVDTIKFLFSANKQLRSDLDTAVEALERISIKTTCDLTQVVADITLAKIKAEADNET